jgi:hypothetical protein
VSGLQKLAEWAMIRTVKGTEHIGLERIELQWNEASGGYGFFHG